MKTIANCARIIRSSSTRNPLCADNNAYVGAPMKNAQISPYDTTRSYAGVVWPDNAKGVFVW